MVAGTERGIEAVYTKTTDTFTLGNTNKKIDLEISHDFHNSVKNEHADTSSHIGSGVTLKNVGDVDLIDVKVYVDVDDDMDAFNAVILASEVNADGTISSGQATNLGGRRAILYFGNIAAGVTATRRIYWWTIRPAFPGSTGSEQRKARFILSPEFTVDYRQGGQTFASTSTVHNAA
jgi:hypothetical protein